MRHRSLGSSQGKKASLWFVPKSEDDVISAVVQDRIRRGYHVKVTGQLDARQA